MGTCKRRTLQAGLLQFDLRARHERVERGPARRLESSTSKRSDAGTCFGSVAPPASRRLALTLFTKAVVIYSYPDLCRGRCSSKTGAFATAEFSLFSAAVHQFLMHLPWITAP